MNAYISLCFIENTPVLINDPLLNAPAASQASVTIRLFAVTVFEFRQRRPFQAFTEICVFRV